MGWVVDCLPRTVHKGFSSDRRCTVRRFSALAVPGAGLNEVIPFLISFLEEPREVQRDLSSSPSFDPCRGPGCVLSTLLLVAMTLHLVGLDCSTDLDDDGEDW